MNKDNKKDSRRPPRGAKAPVGPEKRLAGPNAPEEGVEPVVATPEGKPANPNRRPSRRVESPENQEFTEKVHRLHKITVPYLPFTAPLLCFIGLRLLAVTAFF